MKKILVVDDDNILRRLLKHYLEQHGYSVVEAISGQDGLNAYDQSQPDLIISDIAMPEMDGLKFCRQLRSNPNGQLIPFIFLSAKDDLTDKIQGHSMGADDYITKPFEMPELLAKVEALLERSYRIQSEIIRLIQKKQPLESKVNNNEEQPSSKKEKELPLTPAEARVFWEVIRGLSNKEIGKNLYISPRTVQTHLSSILDKLGLENRSQLINFAYQEGYQKIDN